VITKPKSSLPALSGWSTTMKRWLAESTRAEPAVRWVAVVDDGRCASHVLLDEISAVRVDDLSQVLEHRIARIVGGMSHVIRFNGGGELRYACDSCGQVIELSATGVRGAVSPDRVVTFGALGPDHVR
jgi:hypothetical protein